MLCRVSSQKHSGKYGSLPSALAGALDKDVSEYVSLPSVLIKTFGKVPRFLLFLLFAHVYGTPLNIITVSSYISY